MTTNDILEFENLCREMSVCNKTPPNSVQAFQIQRGSMMSENHYRIVMDLASEFTFKSMKVALKQMLREKHISFDQSYTQYTKINRANLFFKENKGKQRIEGPQYYLKPLDNVDYSIKYE